MTELRRGSRLQRTYVALAFAAEWRVRVATPLGTVVAHSRAAAAGLARDRWSEIVRLRVVRASALPADVVGRALAADGHARRSQDHP